jgi:1,4-dihydroxy-2-naphthoyl-CoA hydrolase
LAEAHAIRKGRPHMDIVTRLQQELPPLPRWMAITVTAASPERVVAELTVREDLCTAGDIMHGGAIMALADTVGALGTVVNLREHYRPARTHCAVETVPACAD